MRRPYAWGVRELTVLTRLVAEAGLAPVVEAAEIDDQGHGLDNTLIRATLEDGTEVLLRINPAKPTDPRVRARFLAQARVGAPRTYASDDSGAALLEFVPGRTLAEQLADGMADDRIWAGIGAAFARVHAVKFPAPLQGQLGPTELVLAPLDPVDQLHANVDRVQPWVQGNQPHLLPAIDSLHQLIDRRGAEIRSETPCLIHGDVNLLNIIVSEDAVTLIDWDGPAVRYPLDELSALDEHVYLCGGAGLPSAFFTGYGRDVAADLLLIYRIVGCLGWLSGDDWTEWADDESIPPPARQRLMRWHERLLRWTQRIPDLTRAIGATTTTSPTCTIDGDSVQ